MPPANSRVQLDLNSPTFQQQLFALSRDQQHTVLLTLRKLSTMSWDQRLGLLAFAFRNSTTPFLHPAVRYLQSAVPTDPEGF